MRSWIWWLEGHFACNFPSFLMMVYVTGHERWSCMFLSCSHLPLVGCLKFTGPALTKPKLSLLGEGGGALQYNVNKTNKDVQMFIVQLNLCSPLSTDISEIESNRSCSPQEDRRLHHSDLDSHSSNEKLKEKQR